MPTRTLVDDAIERCTRHSLLSWSVLEDALIMHRLTARVVRERAAGTGTLDELVTGALTLLESCLFDESQAWATARPRRSPGCPDRGAVGDRREEPDTDIAVRAVVACGHGRYGNCGPPPT